MRRAIVQTLQSKPLLLDRINPVVAYSMRRLRSRYRGACLQVRRESDNAILDIGFGRDGWIDIEAYNGFIASTSPNRIIWYDQSSNNRDAVTTPSSFASISSFSNRFAILCPTNSGFSIPDGILAEMASGVRLAVFSELISQSGAGIDGFNNGPGTLWHHPWQDGFCYEGFMASFRQSFAGYGSSINPTVHSSVNTGNLLSIYKNGQQIDSAKSIVLSNISVNCKLAETSFGGVKLAEYIIFSSDNIDRINFERKTGAAYGISI